MQRKQHTDGAAHSVGLAPATRTTDAETAAIDTLDYQVVEIEIDVGIGGITFDGTDKLEIEVTKSDDNVTYVDAAAGDLLLNGDAVTPTTGGVIRAYTSAKAAASRDVVTVIGPYRYWKVKFEFSGTHGTGTGTAVHVRKAHGRSAA